MKILLFSRSRLRHTAEELGALRGALDRFGFDYAVNKEFAAVLERVAGWSVPPERRYGAAVGSQPAGTILVCYGGDGTLLEGVHRLGGEPLPVLGINAGPLGFLTVAPNRGLDEIFGQIAARRLRIEERTLLHVAGGFAEQPASALALNEFSIQRHGAGMLSVETYVDDQMVATYHGDGVILSTPTGSTAYSLSAGGPVVAPSCACFVLSPLAPHNLTMRPVVIPDTSRIRFRIGRDRAAAFATLDDRSYAAASGAAFEIRKAPQPIFLAVPHNISFYDTLRNKMMWGIDLRG